MDGGIPAGSANILSAGGTPNAANFSKKVKRFREKLLKALFEHCFEYYLQVIKLRAVTETR